MNTAHFFLFLNRPFQLAGTGSMAQALSAGLLVLLLQASGIVSATAIDPLQPTGDPVFEARYKAMIKELRCVVCQNQNIASSNAELAADLRREVRTMMLDKKSDDEIMTYMVDRYGDFVLYRPPMSIGTALLWGGPFVLLLIALGVLLRQVRRQTMLQTDANDPAREKARRLLAESSPESKS